MDNQLLTTSQAAIRLCVTSMSVRRYIDAGLISYILTAGGHYRIPLSEIERLMEQGRNAPTRKTRRRYDAIHITEAEFSRCTAYTNERSGAAEFTASV